MSPSVEVSESLVRLGVAALGGLAVGIEREWSAAREKQGTRFGGVRTFLLLGLLGGLASVLATDAPALGVLVVAAGLAVVVVAYLATAWWGAIDATTEVAAVTTIGAGALAGAGRLVLASALFAVVALVLVEKSRMHAAVSRIQSAELEAAARFAVLALVILPLLPERLASPFGELEPRKLWILVLVFAGISFGGYVALRAAGADRGYGLAGLLGGVVSSTAVALQFARESRRHEPAAGALARGAVAGSCVLPVRVLVLSAVLAPELGRHLLKPLAPALVVAAVGVVLVLRAGRAGETAEAPVPGNPLRLGAALQMVALFTVVLWALDAVRDRFGALGLVGSSALVGLTDLDALTYSVGKMVGAGEALDTAARALLVGMTANTLFKAVVSIGLGAPRFRAVAALGFAAFVVAFGLGFLLI